MNKTLLSVAAAASLVAGASLGFSQTATAADYEIEITNATHSQPFAPNFLIFHDDAFSLFAPGGAPSFELAALAETGDPGPLDTLHSGSFDTEIVTGANFPLTAPFETATVTVTTDEEYMSAVAMLIATNDGFYGVRGVKLPDSGSITVYAPAYDAGSEENNEASGDVPLTNQGNSKDAGTNAGDGEGYVHIHPGIFGVGQLKPVEYDWKNPVAAIKITRLP